MWPAWPAGVIGFAARADAVDAADTPDAPADAGGTTAAGAADVDVVAARAGAGFTAPGASA